MAKILVTGATGFIGGALARSLVAQGHSVRVLRRERSNTILLDDLPVEHCIGDVCDRESLRQAVTGCDHVYHSAACISFWDKEASWQYQVNVTGTRNLVEAALSAGVSRFMHTSSVSALGYPQPDGYVGDETTPYNWGDAYGYNRTKHLAEEEVIKGIAQGLPAVILNPGTVFGPGDINFNGGAYIRALDQNNLLFYPPGGTTVADIFAVVQGHLAAAQHGRIGERYILGGQLMTYREIFATIASVLKKPPPKYALPQQALWLAGAGSELLGLVTGRRPVLTIQMARPACLRLYYSSDKARQELELPLIPFRASVEGAWAWYREKGLL